MKMNIFVFIFTLIATFGQSKAIRESQFEQHSKSVDKSSFDLGTQCEPIQVELCKSMVYNSTRMPNFFNESSQQETFDTANQLKELVSSRCSNHVHDYLCELLTPVCLQDVKGARFKVFPCRSFCRRVKQDCEMQISRIYEMLAKQVSWNLLPINAAFDCDLLPFESNGGEGNLRGPCHETPDSPQQTVSNQTSSNYKPYQHHFDHNQPPIISDTSQIDPNLIRLNPSFDLRPNENINRQQQQQQDSFNGQLKLFGQNLMWFLTRYSNWISIVTVLLLLAALFWTKIRQLKSYLSFSASSSSKSSTNSQHHIRSSNFSNYPSGLGLRPDSASSSSRSLVLVAGMDGKRASHKLLSNEKQESPQKLIHGVKQKTMINVNGSLDRHNLTHNSYLIMQSNNGKHNDKQQLFGTLDSQASSNQYDYIQPQMLDLKQSSRQESQQLYSNILLSSPNHQVLLMGNQRANLNRAQHPTPVQNASSSRHYLAASLAGYSSAGYSVASDLEQQRSFQRRSRHNSSASQRRLLLNQMSNNYTSNSTLR